MQDILERDGRLMYATGVDMGVKGIKVDYYFSFDHLDRSRHTILRTFVDRENPVIKSVTPLTPQADWAERELIEFLGIKAEEHPNPTHLWLPLNWEEMYSAGTEDQGAIHPPPLSKQVHDNIIALPVTAVPYGPYHPAFIESNYFKMSVEDEVVKKADLKLGFNHRSIIKLMERRDYFKDIYLAERVCGLCKVHHALNFCMSVEKIGDIQIPKRAKLLRTLACEMERVQSHLMAIGIASDLIGYKTMLMHSLRVREDIQDSLELITGQRITHGFVTIGGVRRDVTETQADFVRDKLNSMKREMPVLYEQMESNDVWAGRLRKVGVLKPEEAIRLGAVGPTARATGRRLDVRKNSPYAAYEDVDWDIVTENSCDSYARDQGQDAGDPDVPAHRRAVPGPAPDGAAAHSREVRRAARSRSHCEDRAAAGRITLPRLFQRDEHAGVRPHPGADLHERLHHAQAHPGLLRGRCARHHGQRRPLLLVHRPGDGTQERADRQEERDQWLISSGS